jgi:hypothetical protein
MNYTLLAPVLLAAASAWLLDFSRFASAALIGAALAVGLIIAGRRVTVRFAALAFGAALALGVTAMLFAEVIGVPVRALLEGPINEQIVAIALAWAAVMFIGVGFVAAAWGMWRGVPEVDDEPPAGPPR